MVDWPLACLFVVGAVAGGFAGAALGRMLTCRKRALNVVFASLVILVGLYVAVRGVLAWKAGG